MCEASLDGDESLDLPTVFSESFRNEGVLQVGGKDVVEMTDFLGLLFAFADQLFILKMTDDVPVVNSGDEPIGDGSDGVIDVGLGGEDVKCHLRG